jgi:hypothetical protein
MATEKRKTVGGNENPDHRDVIVWAEVPTQDDFQDGIYIMLHDWKAKVDGRYALARRAEENRYAGSGRPKVRSVKDIVMGFLVEKVFAQRVAICMAAELGQKVSVLVQETRQKSVDKDQHEE